MQASNIISKNDLTVLCACYKDRTGLNSVNDVYIKHLKTWTEDSWCLDIEKQFIQDDSGLFIVWINGLH